MDFAKFVKVYGHDDIQALELIAHYFIYLEPPAFYQNVLKLYPMMDPAEIYPSELELDAYDPEYHISELFGQGYDLSNFDDGVYLVTISPHHFGMVKLGDEQTTFPHVVPHATQVLQHLQFYGTGYDSASIRPYDTDALTKYSEDFDV